MSTGAGAFHGSMGGMSTAGDVPGAPSTQYHSLSAGAPMGMMGAVATAPAPLSFDSSADAFGSPSSAADGASYGSAGLGTEWYDPEDMDNEPPLLKGA